MPLLDIRNLTIEFKTGDEWVKAVDRVSMTLTEGEIRGLVGESGFRQEFDCESDLWGE